MLFSSITFLYYFLPVVVIIYYVLPKKLKNTVLLTASIIFYGWGEPKYLVLMAVSILQGYIFGILIELFKNRQKNISAKISLILTITISLSLLGYFKYSNFFIDNFNSVTGLSVPLLKISLPIGISFYTFQILSYSADIYRGTAKARKNLIDFAAYVSMFPQLIAGPIVRYSDISEQLDKRNHNISLVSEGLRRFVIGLSKKVLIANVLGELTEAFKISESKSILFVWLYAVAYTLHIYFDFSGYSDMAIGLGKIFGFSFPENFDYPYISTSITEFWRRWHMSLGRWFKDYLYIPLGGNRVSKPRAMLNIFIVWLATGLWHGASWNFVLWGFIFAVLLIIEKNFILKFLNSYKAIGHIYVIICVIISFVIFDNTDITSAFDTIKDMFGVGNIPLISTESIYNLRNYGFIIIVSIIGATPLPIKIINKIRKNKVSNNLLNIAEPFTLVALLAVVTGFLIDGSFNPFLYFRF
ncbi:MAG: MBOAT family protein [Ruminococcus sp.]|nr:MBOAT family protein [Ruminococcus sp.]